MDVNERNRLFLSSNIDREDLWPKIVEYENQALTFRFQFGLDELPRNPGLITIRGPRQFGKSTWLELQLRDTLIDYKKGSAFFLNGDYIPTYDDLEQEIGKLLPLFSAKTKVKRLFIDEISAIPQWEKAIKRLADRGLLKDVLIVTTGSHAFDLRRGHERLPGRKGKLARTEYIFTGISYKDFHTQTHKDLEGDTWIAYLLSGGSPIAAKEIWQSQQIPDYFYEMMRDWIIGEVVRSGRSRPFLMSTIQTLLSHGGSRLGYLNLAKKSGLANNTIAAEYVEQLTDLLAVVPILAFDVQKKIPIQRKPAKFAFINLAVAFAFHPNQIRSIYDFKSLTESEQGLWVEWLVAQELIRRQCIRGDREPLSLYYGLAGKDAEIDYITSRDRAYEVKRGKTSPMEFTSMLKILGKKHLTVVSSSEYQQIQIQGMNVHQFLWTDDLPHPYPGMVDNVDEGNDIDFFRKMERVAHNS